MIASDSRSRNVEMDHFIPFPFPNFWNALVHSLPVLEVWEWIFYSLPVPEIWKWSFSLPFRFPKFGNGILNSCSCSELKKVIPAHPWQKYTITQLRIYMTTDWNYVLIICVFKKRAVHMLIFQLCTARFQGFEHFVWELLGTSKDFLSWHTCTKKLCALENYIYKWLMYE